LRRRDQRVDLGPALEDDRLLRRGLDLRGRDRDGTIADIADVLAEELGDLFGAEGRNDTRTVSSRGR
jgi:hypothetical protein